MWQYKYTEKQGAQRAENGVEEVVKAVNWCLGEGLNGAEGTELRAHKNVSLSFRNGRKINFKAKENVEYITFTFI